MTRRLVFRPEANLDITEAAEWYERRGLAAGFLRVLDAGFEFIRRDPLLYPVVHGEVGGVQDQDAARKASSAARGSSMGTK